MARLISFPYYGGKHVHSTWIISLLPTDCDHYVEPFCGAASVLLNKDPAPLETMNDLSGEVVEFFKVLRDRGDELIAKLELTPFARDELALANQPTDDPLERARRFYVRARQSINGLVVNTSSWRYVIKKCGRSNPPVNFEKQVEKLSNVANRLNPSWRYAAKKSGGRNPPVVYENQISKLPAVIARLRRVQIENRPALEVIKRFDRPTTLFYCDPPYVHKTRVSQNSFNYEMTNDDHEELADVLKACVGKIALSGYRCELYDKLYGNWRRHDKQAVSSDSTSRKSPPRIESLWCNYQIEKEKTGVTL